MKVESNPRKRRKSRGRRSRRRNPSMSLRRPLGALTSGFKSDAVMGAVPIAGGIALNFLASGLVAKQFPAVSSGIPSYGVGIALAGLSGLVPKVGGKLFVGGLAFQILRLINQFMPGAARLSGNDADIDGDDLNLGELIGPNSLRGLGLSELIETNDLASTGVQFDTVVLD